MASGLLAAASGLLFAIPVVVTDIVMRHHVNWTLALVGLAVAAVPAAYVGRRFRRALAGTAVVTPVATFLTVTAASVSLTLGGLATRSWSHQAYLAALVLPCVFFALSADPVLLTGGLLVVATETAVGLAAAHLGAATSVSLWLLFCSVDAAAAAMVAPTLRRAAERTASRQALAELAGRFAEADGLDAALRDCPPQVARTVPCAAVTVLVRPPTGGRSEVVTLASWTLGGIDVPWQLPAAPADEVFGHRQPVIQADRCVLPLGFTAIGEVALLLEALPRRRLRSPFPPETVAALTGTLLLGVASLGHLSDLERQSRTDALTGLANRRALDERLAAELARSRRTGSPLTVALLDLDGFKDYNDRFGHRAGDQLLKDLARVLEDRVRGGDLVARYGGEEFCVVLPDTDVGSGHRLLDDVRRRIAAISVTVSVGMAQWDGTEAADQLLERADQALYRAKALGKDLVVTAPAPLRP